MGTMRIERIGNGIVMDHIKAGQGIKILKLFDPSLLKTKIDYASYIDSPSMGMKDIIKIENLDVDPNTLMKMTLLAPEISISIIRDGQVHEKLKPKVPPFVEGVIACHNPKCITLTEKYLVSRFSVEWQEDGHIRQQCQYCEHVFHT